MSAHDRLAMGAARAAIVLGILTLGASLARAGDTAMPITTREDASVKGKEESAGGEANGMVTVDPHTGHVRSSYEFDIPKGRGNSTPSIALGHASTGGNGFAGYGWSFTLPSIERQTLSGPPRFKDTPPGMPLGTVCPPTVSCNEGPEAMDLFYFAGQRLVPICTVDEAGQCLSKANEKALPPEAPAPAFARGWHFFRAAEESAFARFFLSPDYRTWVVQTKTGDVLELGVPLGGSIMGAMDVDRTTFRPFRWNLARSYDAQRGPNGHPVNRTIYVWRRLESNSIANLSYLTDVYYTPQADAADSPTSNPAVFAHHIALEYERPTTYAFHEPGPQVWKAKPNLRLSHVDVTSARAWGGSTQREQVRRYWLTYHEQQHTSFLHTIQLEGSCRDNNPKESERTGNLPASSCPKEEPAQFTYHLPSKGIAWKVRSMFGKAPECATAFDVNGDGTTDLVGKGGEEGPRDNPSFWDNAAINSAGKARDVLNAATIANSADWWTTLGRKVAGHLESVERPNLGLMQLAKLDRDLVPNVGYVGRIPTGLPKPGSTAEQKCAALSSYSQGNSIGSLQGLEGLAVRHVVPSLSAGASYTWTNALANVAFKKRRFDVVADPNADAEDAKFTGKVLSSEAPVLVDDLDGDDNPDLLTATVVGDTGLMQDHDNFYYDISTPKELYLSLRSTRIGRDGRMKLFSEYAPHQTTTRPNVKGEDPTANFIAHPDVAWAKRRLDARAAFFADMDRDGIADWVLVEGPGLFSEVIDGAIRYVYGTRITYWPGRGDGVFGDLCDDGTPFCSNDEHYASKLGAHSMGYVQSVRQGANHDDADDIVMGDLTGDRFPELIIKNEKGITIHVNDGGFSFSDTIEIAASDMPAEWMHRESRLQLGDMNGSGSTDLVILQGEQAWYVDPLEGIPYAALREVRTPNGATSTVTYATTTELARAARIAGSPWASESPHVLNVATEVVTWNGLDGAFGRRRVTKYAYRDPVFDGRDRVFRGFKSTEVEEVGDSEEPSSFTETTYFVGRCSDDGGSGCDPYAIDRPFGGLRGRPIVVEKHDSAGRVLSTQHTHYEVRKLVTGLDDITVQSVFPSRTDAWEYDATAPQSTCPITMTSATFETSIKGFPQPVGKVSTTVSIRCGIATAHVVRESTIDDFGNVTHETRYGDQSQGDQALRSHTTWKRPAGDTTGWLWRPTLIVADPSTLPGDQTRSQKFDYDAVGNLLEMHTTLTGTVPLHRTHAAGRATAPIPATVAKEGSTVRTRHIEHDMFGNITWSKGPGDVSCEHHEYDKLYADFAATEEKFTQPGCSGAPLVTLSSFDRGTGKKLSSLEPSGALSWWRYDEFGRILLSYRPDPQTGFPTAKADSFQYNNKGTTPSAISWSWDGSAYRTTFTITDAFGEPLVTLKESDPETKEWIVSGVKVRSTKGQVVREYLPQFWKGSPENFPLSSATNSPSTRTRYDAFGRVIATWALDGTQTSAVVHRALAVDSYDGDHLPGSAGASVFTTTQRDGHGRTSYTIVRTSTAGGSIDEIMTHTAYTAGGKPAIIDTKHSADPEAPHVTRTLRYDSMDRLVLNLEPNTTGRALPSGELPGWRYAYDESGNLVATSDPRGCGKNLAYDAMARLVFEDFSPCLAEHAEYTPAQPDGTGTETFNIYDALEGTSTTSPDGLLYATYDRAVHTRYEYNAIGQTTRIERQIAKPGAPSADLASRYAPRWHEVTTTYDDAGRVTRQSTGAAQLLGVDGKSDVTTSYTPRGLVEKVSGSYGLLVEKLTADADGFVRSVTYGDRAKTEGKSTPDAQRRRARVTMSRNAPGIWTHGASDTYPLPPANAFTTQRLLFDHSFAYDARGNPKRITDNRDESEWPAGAKPVSRTMDYDDLNRIARVDYDYAGGSDVQGPLLFSKPFEAEARVPQLPARRVQWQTYSFDWLGNLTQSDDDARSFFERSLGSAEHARGTHRLTSATRDKSALTVLYDDAGNMKTMGLAPERCPSSTNCVQRFEYEWDEVNGLARARRFDFPIGSDPLTTSGTPAAELDFVNDSTGQRVVKRTGPSSDPRYTINVFGSLTLERAQWLDATATEPERYEQTKDTEHVYLSSGPGTLARVVHAPSAPRTASGSATHVYLMLHDSLGSASVLIDQDTSELVESITYQPHGATESDHRPARWDRERERRRFTGKEDDVELGLIYFGARYYSPHTGRFISPDPLAVHELKADPNVYAYVRGAVFTAVDPTGLYDTPTIQLPVYQPVPAQMGFFVGTHTARDMDKTFKTMHMMAYTATAGVVNSVGDTANTALNALAKNPQTVVTNVATTALTSKDVTASKLIESAIGHTEYIPPVMKRMQGHGWLESVTYHAGGFIGGSMLLGGIAGAFEATVGRTTAAASKELSETASVASRAATGALEDVGTWAAKTFCFAAGTAILTCDGGQQPIETIHAGDRVLSRNDETGAVECRRVVQTFERQADAMAAIEWTSANGLEHHTIHVTLEHPFWVETKGWVAAGALAIGDEAWTPERKPFFVSAWHAYGGSTRVFNFEVDRTHSYFVGPAGILAHNACTTSAGMEAQWASRVPAYEGGKTSGTLVSGTNWIDIVSGYKGPSAQMRGIPGMNGNIKSHVEAHAVAMIRTQGWTESTLFINRIPCPGANGCGAMLPRMLPEGAVLKVIGPDGYRAWFFGGQ